MNDTLRMKTSSYLSYFKEQVWCFVSYEKKKNAVEAISFWRLLYAASPLSQKCKSVSINLQENNNFGSCVSEVSEFLKLQNDKLNWLFYVE